MQGCRLSPRLSLRTVPLYVLALSILVPIVAGCGGSDGDGGNGGGGANVPATITGATVRIAWPERSRAPLGTELSSARSARIVFPKASATGTDVTVNVDRDAAQTAAYTGTYTVPGAILKTTSVFVATFFSDAGEAGTTVGTAVGTLALTGTSLEAGTVVVAGTVRNVTVVPPATLKVGDAPVQLLARATDTKGASVAISEGSVVWSLVSGGTSVRLTKAGLLTAIAAGTATVTASVDGATTAPTTITVDATVGNTQTQVLPLVANDLAYDPISNRIWATIPSDAATSPTTVVAINPASGAVTKTIAFGAEPNKIAITDDGRYAYVSVDADGSIRRLDLTTGAQVATYVIGQGRAALDLAAFPGSPLSFATVGDQSGVNIGIYDSGVLRSGSGAGGNNIQFGSPNVLYGEGNNSGSLFINTITPTSFEFKDQANLDTRGLRYSNGLLYTSNGNVIDPATRTIAGRFPTQSLLVDRLIAVSPSDDRVYINTWNPSTPKRIVVWDRTNRTEIAAYDTGFTPGGSENFIACGNHTVAFNAFGVSSKSIVIVRNLP